MRLLIFSPNYAPWSTGIPKYNAEMGAWLAARGARVDVIAGMPHYPAWRVHDRYVGRGFHEETLDGVRVMRTPLRMPRGETVRARDRILLETSFSWNALRYWVPLLLRRRRYDAVVAICPPLQCALHPWLYRLARGVPFVFHVQDLQVDVALRLNMLRGALVRRLLPWGEALLLRRATRVSTISEAMRDLLVDKGLPRDKIWLVPNWADTRRVRPLLRDNAWRAENGIEPDDMVVLSAGAMGDKHGLEVLLDAARRLRDRPGLRFLLVGHGSGRPALEREVQRLGLAHVRFLPLQPAERLAETLSAADIHAVVQRRGAADRVMPSRLTNILAAGGATIATADPGTQIHDLLVGQRLGVVCAPEDGAALADAISTLAADRTGRLELGRGARLYAERHLDIDAILGEFSERLESLRRTGSKGVAAEPRARPTPGAGRTPTPRPDRRLD